MVTTRKTWFQRHHWYFKGFLVLITGVLALTDNPPFVALFIFVSFWMFCVVVQFLRGAYWTSSRRRRYARMPLDQREDVQRRMINHYEDLLAQTPNLFTIPNMTRAQQSFYRQDMKSRDTVISAIMLYEQWRSELLGVPSRSLPEIRHYWMGRDPNSPVFANQQEVVNVED